jgi:hypothetical protein
MPAGREGYGAAAVRVRHRRICLRGGMGEENSGLAFDFLADELELAVLARP